MSVQMIKLFFRFRKWGDLGKIFEGPDNDAFEAFQKVHKCLNFLDILQYSL